ncbi:DUF4157 domain-containing protein [Moorena producens JHB]|uniref:DUF4157 domain-containing protein n=1 Tax=Moorena producens (strain JHB) TaxID=1454205 RepID=A0A1D9G1E8_MOOP1|nr:DUF4157 domain-containing protein [Moorena producens]AOY81345.2 DUF4157 domain-containing protein [Moorena producens JHB]
MTRQYDVRRNSKSPQKDSDNWILQRSAVRERPAKPLTPQTETVAGDRSGITLDLMEIPVHNQDPLVVQPKLMAGSVGNHNWVCQLKEHQQNVADVGDTPVQQVVEVEAPNNTGLPNRLKAGVENLSGMLMDDVRVHYNSSKPAQLNALAYTQGRDIHVGPGQERHLPHEAWHVVQQKQGRVKATTQFQDLAGNDDPHLEKEAETMGNQLKAAQKQPQQPQEVNSYPRFSQSPIQRYLKVKDEKITSKEDLIELIKKNQKNLNPNNINQKDVQDMIKKLYKSSEYISKIAEKWIKSKPLDLSKTMKIGHINVFGADQIVNRPREEKAYWKEFDNVENLVIALLAESKPQYRKNVVYEQKLADKILDDNKSKDDKIKENLNKLRRKVGEYVEKNSSFYAGYLGRLQGSYNWTEKYDNDQWFPTAYSTLNDPKDLSIKDCIMAMHDMSETLFRDQALPLINAGFPKLDKIPHEVGNEDERPEEWKATVEFDINTKKADRRIASISTRKGEKQDRGKLNLGTRNESSEQTKAARKATMPIEAGISNTTQRMMQMANKAKANIEEKEALALGLFAFWNASKGGYPSSATPVHTYHEVMDMAANFGVPYDPFVYEAVDTLPRRKAYSEWQKSDKSKGKKRKGKK